MGAPSIWRDRLVVVTGGAGFLGSNMIPTLLARGARVRAIDNLERGTREYLDPVLNRIEFVQADLRDAAVARQHLAGADMVFHLASKVGGIQVYLKQPGTVLHANALMDQNVLAAVIAHRIPRLFYASTAHVYPEHLQQAPDAPPLREADAYPARPGLSYGWGKLLGEETVLGLVKEHTWLRVAIARLCGAYGYRQDIGLATGSVIPVFCHRALKWPDLKPFRILGNGTETRSYCFVDDMVEGMLRSIEVLDDLPVAGPFNLGAEGRVTIREIAETVVRISGKDIQLAFDTSAPTAIWGQAVDTALAHRILRGWTPATSLEEGIRRTYEHVRARLAAD